MRAQLRSPLFCSLVFAAIAAGGSSAAGEPRGADVVDIPFQQFTLPNGVRVLVHTDRKAPIVAVNIWYHVGSKNEQRGRSGFAHLAPTTSRTCRPPRSTSRWGWSPIGWAT
jgi:zinc protease